MTDTSFGPLGYFMADNSPQGASAQAMRQKIALAMMLKKGTAPKNLGEGIFSVGQSLADAMIAKNSIAQTAEAAAQTDKNIQDMQRGVTPGAISSSAVPGGETETVASAAPIPPGGNAPSWNQFAQEESPGGLGLSQPQAAGLVGNLQAESTPAIKPSGVVGDEGTAFGTAQWRGPRLEALKQYAASQGVSPWTTEGQQGFMRHELMGTGNQPGREAGSYGALTQAKTPREAAAVFDERYERSSGDARGQRIANAENIARTLPNVRDGVTSALVARSSPPVVPEGGQDARLAEVTGNTAQANRNAYAPTASLRTGDVMSDADPTSPAMQSVIDTTQARRAAVGPQSQPAPIGPQMAQGPSPFPAPVVDASGRVAPIIPGGGFPQPVQAPIPAAPQDPRAAISKAPEYNEKDPEPPPPIKPQGLGPIERKPQIQRALYGDVDPREKAAAQALVAREQSDRNAGYENDLKTWEVKKANWLKKQELLLKDTLEAPKTQADIAKTKQETLKAADEAYKSGVEIGRIPAGTNPYADKMAAEQRQRLAQAQEAEAKSTTAQEDQKFQTEKGLPRSTFIPEFLKAKGAAEIAATTTRNLMVAKEALDSGLVTGGFGANATFDMNKLAARIGSNDAAKIAQATEKYKQAMDSTIRYGVQMVQGNDPKVTNSDIQMAQGITGGDLNLQDASKRRIVDAALENQHTALKKYEGDREYYLGGDKQHRYFKVNAPELGTPGTREFLLKNADNEQARAIFDRDNGRGAAELELARAKRRNERMRKAAEED